jgi:hypothetical protein
VSLAGKGDLLLPDLKQRSHPCLDKITEADLKILFSATVWST